MSTNNYKIQKFRIDQLIDQHNTDVLAFDADNKDYSILYKMNGVYCVDQPIFELTSSPDHWNCKDRKDKPIFSTSEIIAEYIKSGFELSASDVIPATYKWTTLNEYLKSKYDNLGIFERELLPALVAFLGMNTNDKLDVANLMDNHEYGEFVKCVNAVMPDYLG